MGIYKIQRQDFRLIPAEHFEWASGPHFKFQVRQTPPPCLIFRYFSCFCLLWIPFFSPTISAYKKEVIDLKQISFLIVLGIAALCISDRFKDSSLLAALGILILLDSLLSIQTALDSKKFGLSSWNYILIISMVTGTFGVLVILKNTIRFAGCALLAEGGMRHYIVQHTARLPDYRYLNDDEPLK